MTMTNQECPEPQFLQKFLLGQLSVVEIEECQDHLSVCDPCVETVQGLKVNDTFTELTRQALQTAESKNNEDDSIVAQMIQNVGAWNRESDQVKREQDTRKLSLDRAFEVHRLLRDPEHETDLGQLAQFRVLELIGTGSTGVVYRAIDTRLDRNVVLKVLRPSLGEAARSRFVAEAKATATIEHENVITIYEVGEDGPLSFIAMQWIPGQTLEQKLTAEESLSVEESKIIVGEIAAGLSAAHEQGLIHRDIKPANIWMPENGSTKILDFGLVRITDEDPQLTCTGMIAGTPCFMSPEQSRGDQLDARSDLFSLGCLMYQSLTGRLPFRSENALATLRSIQQDQPTSPAELDPAIPQNTSDLVMCLLEKSPSRRPNNADDFIKALETEPSKWEFDIPMSAPATKSAVRKTGVSVWKTIAALAAGIAIGFVGLNYGQQIIRIATNQGEILIETKVDDVQIEVIKDGEVVRVVDLATHQSIEVKAGQYEIRPVGDKNSVSIENNKLVLSRGETQIVTVTKNLTSTVGAIDPSVPYLLSSGDVLGIFIDGVLGGFDQSPPIHYPSPESGLPPAFGFPIHVEHDGCIAIPFIDKVDVSGKTVAEVRKDLTTAFKTGKNPILRDQARILVNLIRKKNAGTGTSNRPIAKGSKNLPELTKSTETTGVEEQEESHPPLQINHELSQFLPGIPKQLPGIPTQLTEIPNREDLPPIRQEPSAFQLPAVPNDNTDKNATEKETKRDKVLETLQRTAQNLSLKTLRNPNDVELLKQYIAALDKQLDVLTSYLEEPVDAGMRNRLQNDYRIIATNYLARAKSQLNNLTRTKPSDSGRAELAELEADFSKQQARFDASEIDELELLHSKAKLLQHTLGDSGNNTEKIAAATELIELSNEQLGLIKNNPEKDVADGEFEMSAVLLQRKNARELLTFFERESGLPVSSPIYDGKTYQELLTIVRTERDLTKLNPAILGVANLAGPSEKHEMLDAVFQVARRGVGVANGEQVKEFNDTVQKIITRLDIETAKDVFITELESGTDSSIDHFFRGKRRSSSTTALYYPIADFIRNKVDADQDLSKPFVIEIMQALEEYSDSKYHVSQAFRFITDAFENNWAHWGLPNNKSAKAICQKYFDEFLQMPDNSWWRHKLAELMPATKGFKEHLTAQLTAITKATEEQYQNGERLDNRIKSNNHFLNILFRLPRQDLPQEQVLKLANIYLKAWYPDGASDVLRLVDENYEETMRVAHKIRNENRQSSSTSNVLGSRKRPIVMFRFENDRVVVEIEPSPEIKSTK